ncbi:MAG TPA: ABC transporter ATP-binding protein, partial [Caulobacteraceae bacterium]
MDQYEDDEVTRRRVLSNSQVLAFIAGYWRRRPWLFAATVALTVAAIGFELYLPRAAQAMVNATTGGRSQIGAAWRGWRLFVLVYVAFSVLRNLGMRFWNPLSALSMQEMTDEGFRR